MKRYESNVEVIRVCQTAHTNSNLFQDLLVANKPGTYILHWDNSYSWTKRKFLEYRFNILPPTVLGGSSS